MIKLTYPDFWQKRSWLSTLLAPVANLYAIVSSLRHLWTKPIRFHGQTICIGNCTVGGTGKTQLTIWLAQELTSRDINFVILCRGYRSKCTEPTMVTPNSKVELVGDEALELAAYGPTIATPNFAEAMPIIEQIKPQIIIVDDGMQNPSFHKDKVLMTVDGMRGFGNGMLLPAGPMRSSVEEALEVCDAVIISHPLKCDIPYGEKPVFHATITTTYDFNPEDRYYAFAGIGNPERFFTTLAMNGLLIVDSKAFGDHHYYSAQDVEELQHLAAFKNAKLITTRKDYVKVKGLAPEIICFEPKLCIPHHRDLLSLLGIKSY